MRGGCGELPITQQEATELEFSPELPDHIPCSFAIVSVYDAELPNN